MTMQIEQKQDFLTVVKSRRSVRVYDPNFAISKDEIDELLRTAVLAPSSSNLQPWRFLVIQDAERKQQLLPIAFNQQQVVEASAVIAVLADLKSYEKAELIYDQAVKAGYMSEATKTDFVSRTVGMYGSLPPAKLRDIALVDGGLVSMQLMLAAKAKGYDTVPMGGYDAAKFKEAFGISEQYAPVMLIALGKAAKEGHPTARMSVDDVTYWNHMNG